MKKLLIVTSLLLLTVFGMSKTANSSDPKLRTHAEAIEFLTSTLRDFGLNCKVVIKDINNNDVPDYLIRYLSGGANMTDGQIIFSITLAVAGTTKITTWKSDKVYFMMSEQVAYIATTYDCRRCLTPKLNGTPKEKAQFAFDCISQIWTQMM